MAPASGPSKGDGMSDDQRNGGDQGASQQPGEFDVVPESEAPAGGAEEYAQQPDEGEQQGAEGDSGEQLPEGYELYHGRTGVPDYVPQDDSPIDPSLKEKNTGGAIKLIVGIAVVLVVAAIGAYLLMGSHEELKEHELARDAYKAANLKGHVAFWKKVNIPIAAAKDITDFGKATLDLMKEKTRMPFADMLKKEAVPILDAALPDYEAIKAPAAYADKAKAVVDAVKGMKEAALDLSGQLTMIDAALEAQTKMKRRSDAWFNAQTWEDPQYHAEAFAFYKLLGCILDRPIVDIPAAELSAKISESCTDKKDAWFKRVGVECYPLLLPDNGTPDEAFKATVAAYRKKGEEAAKAKAETSAIDETSIDYIKECAEAGRIELENGLAAKFKAAFMAYEKASKEFLQANNDALAGK
jgi:hypothetical protein